jgi:outer membrane biosynthesis protein TonB
MDVSRMGESRKKPADEVFEEGPGNSLLSLVDYHVEAPRDDLDEAVEEAGDGSLSILGKPISPPRRRLTDSLVIIGLIASALLHLALVVLIPRGERLYQQYAAAHLVKKDDIPPVYLFPYLPHDKTEPPATAKPALSDKARRAHGGEGAPDTTPGVHGNTEEPFLEPPPQQGRPGSAAREAGGEKGAQARVPAAPSPEAGHDAASTVKAEPRNSGADAILQLPKQGEGEGQRAIKGLSGLGAIAGAGSVPNHRGGQVDLGPLSFDTQWYDWGPYAREMLRRIKYHWRIPEIALLGVAGVTRIHFFIGKNGTVSDLEILQEADHPPMTFAARDAILDASPLPPLPADLGSDREGVTISFYYNSTPPKQQQDDSD